MERLEIPVIGIGAGAATDGQVLVFHDLLGIYDGHAPRFAKRYAEVKAQMVAGVAEYAAEVRGAFPGPEHVYSIDDVELDSRFRAEPGRGRRSRQYSIALSTRAGAPAAIEYGGMSEVTTEFAPITQRSPIVDPARDHDVHSAPDVVADAGRSLGGEPLPRDRALGVVEAVDPVADEAAVGEHAVIADLDQLQRGDHHADVQERPRADPDPRLPRRRQPDCGSSSVCSPISSLPSPNASSTLPWSGHRANAPRRISSTWIRARFHGSELRSYQRHLLRPQLELLGGRQAAAHNGRGYLARGWVPYSRSRTADSTSSSHGGGWCVRSASSRSLAGLRGSRNRRTPAGHSRPGAAALGTRIANPIAR